MLFYSVFGDKKAFAYLPVGKSPEYKSDYPVFPGRNIVFFREIPSGTAYGTPFYSVGIHADKIRRDVLRQYMKHKQISLGEVLLIELEASSSDNAIANMLYPHSNAPPKILHQCL